VPATGVGGTGALDPVDEQLMTHANVLVRGLDLGSRVLVSAGCRAAGQAECATPLADGVAPRHLCVCAPSIAIVLVHGSR